MARVVVARPPPLPGAELARVEVEPVEGAGAARHVPAAQQAAELELPDRNGYRFYLVVHISRLKLVDEFGDRPKTRLAPGVVDDTRLDVGEELLREDSWELDHMAGEYEVEAILDDRVPLATGIERAVREFRVKWVGYDEPTWEPAANRSCGGLLYDYLRRKRSEQRLQMIQVADAE
ncbi:hypothetical protein ON010_g9528 [Phytophthora cinnamomi]|nr:hypothetical protein ON010_g9528 [Phytophthora cinnamomi]